MVVGTGNPDHEIRRKSIKRAGEAAEKLIQVHHPFDIAHGFDIERAGALCLGGRIMPHMDRVGENTRIPGEQRRCAAAAMGIGIDHHDADVGLA